MNHMIMHLNNLNSIPWKNNKTTYFMAGELRDAVYVVYL